MREIRAEVAMIFEAMQDKGSRKDRKQRSARAQASAQEPASRARESSSYPRWLTHVSVALALSMVWNFFITGQFEKSVERKLLLSLCTPMLWLYVKATFFGSESDRGDTKTQFIISNIAWFLVGFVCCAFLHPHN
mmetsp:Transcript_11737/g.30390  ORF Transcript_11737/g.30390 Transcript_11737/m.30390 type:complete len:135 (+) Transcript_11737:553-957(+)